MTNLLIIGAGGFLGAIARYLVAGFAQDLSGSINFPYGTLAVNLIGCFFIGLLAYLADVHGVFSPQTRLLVFIGFLGSFTTFSTFEFETFGLLRGGDTWYALADVFAHVLLGLIAVCLGQMSAMLIWRS